jgi:Uma2 family endonuclease
MPETLIHPPKTILEVWESLPEGTLCQIINSKLIMSPAPIVKHQQILNEINIEISIFLKKNLIGKIFISPIDVHFSDENILQPDILFIENKNLNIVEKKRVNGAPNLIIEILSPSTSQVDYEEKKSVYERFGVQEYFIVDPNTKSVDSFFLKGNKFEQQKDSIGKIDSKILGTNILF